MGGAVSAGVDNEDLINNLIYAGYIKTASVEQVFRAVDRGHFFTPECMDSAYKDLAWKHGNLHISAPCIYSQVMECLQLKPGMSFLNLGSGTGYLSTMAGLVLGCHGVNHGVEIHSDVLEYAKARLDEFSHNSIAVDEYEFCPPRFVEGNCLSLPTGGRQYDRVYCGAACPANHEGYMTALLKVDGILVVPINDQLLQIHRTSESNFEVKAVLPVSFATLLASGSAPAGDYVKLPETEPWSLQELCRFTIRAILRGSVTQEHPELKRRAPRFPRKRVKRRALTSFVIPIFGSDSEDAEPQQHGFIMDIQRRPHRGLIDLSDLLEHTLSPPARLAVDNDDLSDSDENEEPVEGSSSGPDRTKAKKRREKLDSGIVEDMESGKAASSSESDSEDSDTSDMDLVEAMEIYNECIQDSNSRDNYSTTSEAETEDIRILSTESPQTKHHVYATPPDVSTIGNYRRHMQDKISVLPLPQSLKIFLNLNRDL